MLMHSSNTQHGRQPQPQPAAPPTDPRKRNVPPAATTSADLDGVCRDFVWGICTMGAQCKYRHELVFESMKKILKFCHDHQNRSRCTRPDCTYLHTSRDEENLFLTTGRIPRVLMERYTANMSAAPVASASVVEPVPAVATVPPHMLYECIVQGPPPPPPPPPPLPPAAGGSGGPSPPSSMTVPAPMPVPMHSMSAPMQAMPAPMPTMVAPPPTAGVTSVRVAGPAYSAAVPSTSQGVVYPPQPLPIIFDPTRPPPPLPPANKKRQTQDEHEAGPSKLRKSETVNDSTCESCVQRLIRCNIASQKIETMEQESNNQRAKLNRIMSEYEEKKSILRTLLRPDLCRMVEEYIEHTDTNVNTGSSSSSNVMSQLQDLMAVVLNGSMSAAPSPLNSSNTNPLAKLLELIGGTARSGLRDASPTPEDNLMQSLNARSRSDQNDDAAISAIFEILRNSERSSARDITEGRTIELDLNRANTSGTANPSNGFSRFLSEPSPSIPRYPARPIEGVAGPSGLTPNSSRSYADAVCTAPLPPRAYDPVQNPPAPIPPTPVTNPYDNRLYLENNIPPSMTVNVLPYVDSAGASGPHPHPHPHPYSDNSAGPVRYPPAQAAPPRQYHPGLCEGATVPPNAPPATAPPMYAPGSYATPTQTHVVRNYYSIYPPNNPANPSFPGMAVSQAQRPPPSGMPTVPQNQQNYQQYMGRYPYYPPF